MAMRAAAVGAGDCWGGEGNILGRGGSGVMDTSPAIVLWVRGCLVSKGSLLGAGGAPVIEEMTGLDQPEQAVASASDSVRYTVLPEKDASHGKDVTPVFFPLADHVLASIPS